MNPRVLGSLMAIAVTVRGQARGDDHSAVHVDAALRGGIVASVDNPALGTLFGGALTYRLGDHWRAGAYVEVLSMDYGDLVSYDYDPFRFGARGELHVRPEDVFDPWVGLAIGVFRSPSGVLDAGSYDGSPWWGGDFEVNVGPDFHIGDTITLGACFALIVPFINDRPPFESNETEPRLGGFLAVPFLARAAISF